MKSKNIMTKQKENEKKQSANILELRKKHKLILEYDQNEEIVKHDKENDVILIDGGGAEEDLPMISFTFGSGSVTRLLNIDNFRGVMINSINNGNNQPPLLTIGYSMDFKSVPFGYQLNLIDILGYDNNVQDTYTM
ncbi:MAG: hypothetical protein AB8B66_02410 [Rickettsiaceae bacterium]